MPSNSETPGWVKLFASLGAILCLGGFALFGYGMITWTTEHTDPGFRTFPPGVVGGGVLFFIGFVVMAIAAIGRSMSR